MVFKRLLYNIVAIFVGFSLGILLAPLLGQLLGLPMTVSAHLMVASVFAAFVGAISYFVTAKLQKISQDATDETNAAAQQQWAWLKPAGRVARSPYPINKEQVIIGRDINCDIMLKNDSVSRRHAEVIREADGWRIRDLHSSNGTFVNGRRTEEIQLVEGDVITLGDINMTFEGPRNPIPSGVPEPVSQLVLSAEEQLVLETQIHTVPSALGDLPPDMGDTNTEIYHPRENLDDL